MDIRPIRNEADHAEALEAVSDLMDQNPEWGTPAFDRMDVLTTLIEAYEARKAPIGLPNPIEAIEVRLAEKGISQRALASVTRIPESKISEVLGYKRSLSINMIRAIGPVLDLPVELLVQAYPVTTRQSVGAYADTSGDAGLSGTSIGSGLLP